MARTTLRMVGTFFVLAGVTGALLFWVPDRGQSPAVGASGASIRAPEPALVESESAGPSEATEALAAEPAALESDTDEALLEGNPEETESCFEDDCDDELRSDNTDWCQTDDGCQTDEPSGSTPGRFASGPPEAELAARFEEMAGRNPVGGDYA